MERREETAASVTKNEGEEGNKKGAPREKMKFPFPGRSLNRVQSFRRREYRFLWARDPHCLCGFLVDEKEKREEEGERIKSKEIG